MKGIKVGNKDLNLTVRWARVVDPTGKCEQQTAEGCTGVSEWRAYAGPPSVAMYLCCEACRHQHDAALRAAFYPAGSHHRQAPRL